MIQQTTLGGSFTFPATSLTVNRMGYGAMQLAGREGNKLVWGPPKDVDGAIAILREAVARGVNHFDTSDFLWSPRHEPNHTKGAVSLPERSSDRDQGQRAARR
jgi:aryl-alcohol dehydrogenase-like predicted oxidoreductase